jgi:hypothetical protein
MTKTSKITFPDIFIRMSNNIPKTTRLTLKRIVEGLGEISGDGFGAGPKTLTAEQKNKLQQMASMWESYGQALHNEEAIQASAKGLTELCELAETYAISECGDVFQENIVKRDMQNLKKRVTEYAKVAKECYARMQELGVAYQDIGHVLGRYYNLKSTPQPGGMNQPVQGMGQGEPQQQLGEDGERSDFEIASTETSPSDYEKCPGCGKQNYLCDCPPKINEHSGLTKNKKKV